jgi:translocation and assembly module TamB
VIDDLGSDLVILHRLPNLIPSNEPKPILPGFDVRIARLRIAQLRIEPGVTGQRRIASVSGEADIRAGRALIDLKAKVRGGGDALALLIDAEPDKNRFDVDIDLDSPVNSVAGAIVGTKRPMRLKVKGDGSWRAWAGSAELDLSGRRSANLSLRAADGVYSVNGSLAGQHLLKGKLQRLIAPVVLVNARSTFVDRRLDGTLSLRSSALKVEAKGVVDLARSSFGNVRIGTDLLRPAALFPNMTADKVRMTALLNGPFRRATFAYRIATPKMAFDRTGFEDVLAEGRGRFSRAPVSVPIRFTARRVTGVGAVAGGILANLRVEGVLKVTSRLLTGEGLNLTSDKLKGKVGLLVDLRTGGSTWCCRAGSAAI